MEHRVKIIRSDRRRRTVQAAVVDGVIEVRIPAGLDAETEERMVNGIVAKVRRKLSAGEVDLTDRAARIARRFDLPVPDSIEWSDRQRTRWGSCTPGSRTIRISNRLAAAPDFVLDYVLVHELAHLAVPDHGPAFRRLTDRYADAERAKGYLQALTNHGLA
ncbi:MAG: M48 family metallopeptidase [Acidimicrobiia bacterium]|nr:M48 family metallopeptidase [Acidimicrobiia bacterium]